MVSWYKERVPVGFIVHVFAVLLIRQFPLPFWLALVTIVWHEVGKLIVHHRESTPLSLSKRAGVATASAGCVLSALDWYIEVNASDMLWPHACLRGIIVFVAALAFGAAWKDAFSISYLLLACTACTQLFVAGSVDEFIGHVSIVCASDAFQYFVGKAFGRHKAVPTVSPNKTLEGYAGGVILCNLLSPVFAVNPLDLSYLMWYNGVLVCGIIGDLSISSWKRYHVVKDTSDVLASHGGLLDRVDSHVAALLFTAGYISFMEKPISGNYTGIDAYRMLLCTGAVWAVIIVRWVLRRNPGASDLKSSKVVSDESRLHAE